MPKVKNKKKNVTENLLVEHSLEFIVESSEIVTLYEGDSEGGDKTGGTEFLKLTGVVQKGNTPNGNNRIYKTELLTREVGRFQSKMSQGLAMGKVYHPGFFDQGGPAGVTDVSHRMTKLWMDGDIVRGELLVFKTASGQDVEAITEGGGRIGISSRGYGGMKYYDKAEVAGVKYKDVYIVDTNYRLDTFDLVLTPSVKTAIMRPVKSESLDGDVDDGVNNCDEQEDFKGGNSSMTIEELKAKHPELYNTVHDAAVKEGKGIGLSDAVREQKSVLEAKDSEIGTLKEANTTLTTENITVKKENEELKATNVQLEADKLTVDIKAAVVEAVGKSDFKDYFKETDIDYITAKSESVEAAAGEVTAREKVYESAVATFKATSTPVDTKSKSVDTSEQNTTDVKTESATSKEDAQKAFAKSQRALAFGH